MKNQRRGFTLIELLVVVLIIGILSAIALPQYEKAVVKSRVATIMPVLATMREAQEVYYMENGQYTNNPADLGVNLPEFCTWLSNPYDSTGAKNMYTCGKYFVVDIKSGEMTKAGTAASYCPNYTANLVNCLNKRDFIIVQKFINSTEHAGKHYCYYYNATGNTMCKNLTGKSTPDTGVIYYF